MTSSDAGSSPSAAAEEALGRGREHDLAGQMHEAVACYATAIDLATGSEVPHVLAEALRRLGVLYHRRAEPRVAADLCRRSYSTAVASGSHALAAEALNTLAGFALEQGRIEEARAHYRHALHLAGTDQALAGKIEQNLGIAANIQGDWDAAVDHYQKAQALYERAFDRRGAAIACHNLGMSHADQKRWADAEPYFQACEYLATAVGDAHLTTLAKLGLAQVRWAEQRYETAKTMAEAAVASFAALDARGDEADAHRVLGMILRDSGQHELAEMCLEVAVAIAMAAHCPLTEADAARELAELRRHQGRDGDAMRWLDRARQLYRRLHAAHALADVEARARALASEARLTG